MNKILRMILPVLISLAVILPVAPAVLAADQGEDITVDSVVRERLLIRAPNTAAAGQPVTIAVYGSGDRQPVAGAEVYALRNDSPTITANKKNDAASIEDYGAFFNSRLIYIGITNGEGNVTRSFRETGRYLLLAFKTGFNPGFSYMGVTGSSTQGLSLRVPNSGEAGQQISLGVFDKASGDPVASAAIYAWQAGDVSTNKPTVAAFFKRIIGVIKPQKIEPATANGGVVVEQNKPVDEVQNIEEVKRRGFLLGYTTDDGKLVYTFERPGYYALTAIKDTYSPAFARLSIVSTDRKSLGIKAPDKAEIDSTVVITVFERRTNQVVPKAGVYALRLGDLLTVAPAEKKTTTILTPTPVPVEGATDSGIDAETVRSRGVLLGYTDEKGRLECSFAKAGHYVLAASHDDYLPGFARISIVPVYQKAIGVKLPGKAQVNTKVNLVAFDRQSSGGVNDAVVYALWLSDSNAPAPLESIIGSEEADLAAAEKRAADISARGIKLGHTDENGHLTCVFPRTGHYAVVAVKEGYIPGFARITIVPLNVINPGAIAPVPKPLPNTNNSKR